MVVPSRSFAAGGQLRTRFVRMAAVAGAAIAALTLAGCSLLPTAPAATNDAETADADVFTVKVGDCLNDGGAEGEISSVPIVDCDEPHDSEAFASIILDDGDYPGKEAVFAQANEGCEAAFASFVGIAFSESVYKISYYYPTAASWATGDREILCLIIDPAGKIESGSLSGIAR